MTLNDPPWTTEHVAGVDQHAATAATSARLLVEEREGGRDEQRRAEDIIVGQAGQDRQRVATLRAALAHPAAVAQAAVEQVEDLGVVAWRSHVGVGGNE